MERDAGAASGSRGVSPLRTLRTNRAIAATLACELAAASAWSDRGLVGQTCGALAAHGLSDCRCAWARRSVSLAAVWD